MKITPVIVFTRLTWKTALYIYKPIYIYIYFLTEGGLGFWGS
ncbi:unnamed protein product [Larinioides sclopetarius]|uniref:Uncharacterized protein n=1 Tax=Larinioides sclopetarius TaxID=280406 RepID=A0AAV2A457_9ARAC